MMSESFKSCIKIIYHFILLLINRLSCDNKIFTLLSFSLSAHLQTYLTTHIAPSLVMTVNIIHHLPPHRETLGTSVYKTKAHHLAHIFSFMNLILRHNTSLLIRDDNTQRHSRRKFFRKMVQRSGVWQNKPMTSPDQDPLSTKSNSSGFES